MFKKRILCLILMLCFSVTLLTGCNLIETNNKKYYNSPIVVIDDDIVITREEFSTYYNSYYNYQYNLYASYGLTNYMPTISVDTVLNNLIQERIIVREAKKMFTLTNAQKNEIWQNVYDVVNSNIKSYYDQIKLDWDITDEKEDEDETSTSSSTQQPSKIEDYVKKVQLVVDSQTGKYKLVKVNQDEIVDDEVVVGGYDNFVKDIDDEKLYNEGYKRYIKSIKNYFENRGEEVPKEDKDVLEKELNRLYKNYEDSFYYDLFSDNYYNLIDVSLDEIKARAKDLILEDYTAYTLDSADYKTAIKDSSKASEVYYHTSDSSNYFMVSHILIKYNDSDLQSEGNNLNTLKDGGLTDEAYQSALTDLMQRVKTSPRNDDFEVDKSVSKSVKEIYDELKSEMNSKSTLIEKMSVFTSYINKYNEDPGITTSTFNYVMGVDDSNSMDQHFYETSKYLFEDGQVGDVDIALSDYGFHIIVYCGTPGNNITVNSAENFEVTDEVLSNLNNTIVKVGINKNYIDKIYEEIASNKFNEYKENLVQKIYDESYITIYQDKIDEMIN